MTLERGLEPASHPAVLPRKLADLLRPELSSVAKEITDEIRATITAYARPLDGPYGKSITAGVEYAITLFVAQIADPSVSKEQSHKVHHRLGQNEMREGRSLDTLQSAYRVGARVSWRRIMRVGRRAGLSSAVMSQLADAMLAFMDELASVALDGYLEAKASTAGALDTWRRKLLQLILEFPPTPPNAIAELAQLIGWTVPEEVTPVAVHADTGGPRRHAPLDADVLAELEGMEPRLVIPGQVGGARLTTLQAAIPDCRLAIEPTVRLEVVSDSLRWARRALVLAERGLIPCRRVVWAEEHLPALLLHSDTNLVARLGDRLFEPLGTMTDKQREAPAGDVARVAGRAGERAGHRRSARRAPADRALPHAAAAGGLRRPVAGLGCPLRAGDRAAGRYSGLGNSNATVTSAWFIGPDDMPVKIGLSGSAAPQLAKLGIVNPRSAGSGSSGPS